MTILVLKTNYCDDWGSPIGNLHMSSQDLPKHSSRTAASCCCWLLSCRRRFLRRTRETVKPWNQRKRLGSSHTWMGSQTEKNGGLMASQCVSVFVHVFSPTKNGGLRKQMRGLLKELQWAEVGRSGQNAEMMDSGIKPHLDGVPCRSAMGDLPSLAKDWVLQIIANLLHIITYYYIAHNQGEKWITCYHMENHPFW